MSELKPCPFCGGEAHVAHYYGDTLCLEDPEKYTWFVSCASRGCPGSVQSPGYLHRGEAEALAAWNRRASPWVPVTERLPEWSGYYPVWNPSPGRRPFVAWYDANRSKWDTKKLVSHWGESLPDPLDQELGEDA